MKSHQQTDDRRWLLIFSSWLIATLSTLGSLFFSEIMELVPCVLCWYQRIFMFPLVVILLVGLYPLDKRVVNYALPIAVIGLLFTLYHCLLFFGLIPENLQPCSQGVSCADDSMVLFGFLPISLLSLLSFSLIIILLLKSKVST
ncbi:MAG: disulfide bond formation protein B [Gammaproteobacteria bacterium]|nr:disulfide bond formation protein B [Gammaproteobacteria bacterium]MCF6230145.1 disulfide bond formation protein B [Gammaproteobacteria bacterium]